MASFSDSFDVSDSDRPDLYYRCNQSVLLCQADGVWYPAVIQRLKDCSRASTRVPFMRQALVSPLPRFGINSRWVPCCSSRLRFADRPEIEPISTARPPRHILDDALRLLDEAFEHRTCLRWSQAALAECRAFCDLMSHLNCVKSYPDHCSIPDDWTDVCMPLLNLWFTSLLPMLLYHYESARQLHENFRKCFNHPIEPSAVLSRTADLAEAASNITFWSSQIKCVSLLVDDQVACLNQINPLAKMESNIPICNTLREIVKQWRLQVVL